MLLGLPLGLIFPEKIKDRLQHKGNKEGEKGG